MNRTKEEAKQYLHTIAGNHLPRTARRYTMHIYTGQNDCVSVMGFQFDIKPFTGKVVEVCDSWIVIKGRGAEFMVVNRDLIKSIPDIGATIEVTTYARHGFDGRRLDETNEEVSNGIRYLVYHIGKSNSDIPIDKKTLKSQYLKDLIGQIEKLPCPDGIRNLSNALVDFGGSHPGLVNYNDPTDAKASVTPAALEFAIDTLKFKGTLVIEYNRATDYYEVVLKKDEVEQRRVDNIDFTRLASVVCDMVDDGEWIFAKYKVLKKAPKVKAA